MEKIDGHTKYHRASTLFKVVKHINYQAKSQLYQYRPVKKAHPYLIASEPELDRHEYQDDILDDGF